MKDVKIKELLAQWKETAVDTSLFIAKWTVVFANWLWKEIQRFFRGCTWITYLLIMVFGCCLVANHELRSERKTIANGYIAQFDSLQSCIDSLDFLSKNEILAIKAGEYHMTPHSASGKITKDSVASLLKELQAWYPDIIMAQIQTESGFGTSDVARNANNLLGMKKTNKRKTTQIKNQSYKGYGMYNNWESCVIDRVMWDYACFGNKKPSREAYIAHLNSCYAESNQYGTNMDRYGKQYVKYL